jgi:hypothetical protein
VTEWINWAERRPERGWRWWRVPPRNYGGLELQMEFVTDVSLHGMGYAESEYWPSGVSHWDGYRRTVPQGLQWLEGEMVPSQRAVRFPGLNLAPCPFCGGQPKVDARERPKSGGEYLTGSKLHAANFFEIRCCIVKMADWDFARIVSLWNTRRPERLDPEIAPVDYEIGFRLQVKTDRGWIHMRGSDSAVKSQTAEGLTTVGRDYADSYGCETRLVEFVPFVHSEYTPTPIECGND